MSETDYVTNEALGGSRITSGLDVAEANRRVVRETFPNDDDWMSVGPGDMEKAVASAAAGKPNALAERLVAMRPKVVQEDYAFGGFHLWLRKDVSAEIIRSLESYPLLDERTHSEVETEMERQSFDSWMRGEIVERAAKEYADQGHADALDFADAAAEVDGNVLWPLYLEAKGDVGAQYLVEGAGNTLDGIDRVASALLPRLVAEVERSRAPRP